MQIQDKVAECRAHIDAAMTEPVQWAIVCGSGLAGIADGIDVTAVLDYRELPHFATATAPGHTGQLVLGRLRAVPVACMLGRLHTYEGYSPEQTVFPVHVLASLGIRHLVVTNAAGAINEGYAVGDIMLISDHINFTGSTPLSLAANDPVAIDSLDMTFAYPQYLRDAAREAAAGLEVELREGVYLGVRGPAFETPAEIRAFRAWGADAVGMSTVHEVTVANCLGLDVLGLSLMTNMAAGILGQEITADEIYDVTAMRTGQIMRIIAGVVAACGQN
jgi:purine-nucleoside phosphorylase